ncbi:uncharacterized protein LOC114408339 [Glycine soja]|uniref:uncharacterized protein LOC114408339 n=1 Tax=Glycine soja TaxID=3848 RepID=UPI001039DFD0|nr:uncharacterized protein LOC114408339 [Glycine soja]
MDISTKNLAILYDVMEIRLSSVMLSCPSDQACTSCKHSDSTTNEVFVTRDDVLQWARSVAHENGFMVVIMRSDTNTDIRGMTSFVLIGCEMSGQYRSRKKDFVRRDTGSRKFGCPFKLRGKPLVGGQGMTFSAGVAYLKGERFNNVVSHDKNVKAKLKRSASSSDQPIPRRIMPMLDQFHSFIHDFTDNIVDAKADGNCGYRAIAALLGMREDSWSLVCNHLLKELGKWSDDYIKLFGSTDRLKEIRRSLLVIMDKWMDITEMRYIIASRCRTYEFTVTSLLGLPDTFNGYVI